jgi:hypothetical protein
MPLFPTAVLNKYLKQQAGARMATAYAAFRAHFHKADQLIRKMRTPIRIGSEGRMHTAR